MAERVHSFEEVMNFELMKCLMDWKMNSNERTTGALNELFTVVSLLESEMVLTVNKEAILGEDSAILPQEAAIYGREQGDYWIFDIPPEKTKRDGLERYRLFAIVSLEPRLAYSQLHHSMIASFKAKDVISVEVK